MKQRGKIMNYKMIADELYQFIIQRAELLVRRNERYIQCERIASVVFA